MRNTSAYSNVREWILNVADNQESEVTKIPSERQLGKILNVSRDTVRRAVSALVEEGVLDARQGAGTYIRRQVIKNYQKRNWQGSSVGIVIFSGKPRFEVSNYPWVIMQSAINELCAKGIKAQLINIGSNGILAAREIISHKVSGLIWVGPDKDSLNVIDYLQEHNIPVITIGGDLEETKKLHNIVTDDFAGGFIGGEYLLKKGHNKILFVSLTESRTFDYKRFAGFKNAMAKYGVKVDENLVLRQVDFMDIYNQVRFIIKNGPEFSAIFCADGIYVNTIYNAIRDEGKKIPKDYSLITYDKSREHECPGIELVEIRQPLAKLGKAAVKKLINILTGKQKSFVNEQFLPKIFDGNSCAKIKWTGGFKSV